MTNPYDVSGDVEVVRMRRAIRRQRLKDYGKASLFAFTGIFLLILVIAFLNWRARVEREFERYLKQNECKVTSRIESTCDLQYSLYWGEWYLECDPPETCYDCKKNGDVFCEAH